MSKKASNKTAAPVASSSDEQTKKLHDMAVAAMVSAHAAAEAKGKAKEGAEGAAIIALRMFQTGATEASLREAFTTTEAEARSGSIKGVTLREAARKGKDGATQYLIPGSFMNAKSVTCKAASYGITRKVSSFTELKKLVKDENERQTLKDATAQELAYIKVKSALERLSDAVREPETAKLSQEALKRIAQAIDAATDWLAKECTDASTAEVTTATATAENIAALLNEAA